ncbi:MAG: DUF434 domain-containing protein [Thermoproteota archaeon]|nr:MAG: DUF434 domain-containing protein [Candidatus Korarchaeota archaeon]
MRLDLIDRAASDLAILLAMGLPERRSLELVGDRYGLTRRERVALSRIVRSPSRSLRSALKKVPPSAARGREVRVDGFNVLITVEALLAGEPVYLCSDGFLRDLRMAYSSYSPTEETREAVLLLAEALRSVSPSSVLVVYDEPTSFSGELAAVTRRALSEVGVPGTAATSRRVDSEVAAGEVSASSDEAVILKARAVVDVPELVAARLGVEPRQLPFLRIVKNFSRD